MCLCKLRFVPKGFSHFSQRTSAWMLFLFLFFEMHLPHVPFQIMGVSAYFWALSAKKFLCGWLLFCSYKCSKPNVWFYLLHHLRRSRRIFCLVTLLMPRQFFLIWKQFSTLRTSLCCFWLFFLCAVCFVYSDYVWTLFHSSTTCECEGIETFLFSCAVSCGFCVDPFQLGMPGILRMWNALCRVL